MLCNPAKQSSASDMSYLTRYTAYSDLFLFNSDDGGLTQILQYVYSSSSHQRVNYFLCIFRFRVLVLSRCVVPIFYSGSSSVHRLLHSLQEKSFKYVYLIFYNSRVTRYEIPQSVLCATVTLLLRSISISLQLQSVLKWKCFASSSV